MNDNDLCQWLRANSSGTYRPSAEAADRIEALNIEVAELKASIPQIKDDAIMREMQSTDVIQTDPGAIRGDLYLWAAYPDNNT